MNINYIVYAGLMFKTISGEYATPIISPKKRQVIDAIFTSIHEVTEVTRSQICIKNRTANVREARQIAHYLMSKQTDCSLHEIGNKTNNNHTTVIHSKKVIEQEIKHNKTLNARLALIEEKLKQKISSL